MNTHLLPKYANSIAPAPSEPGAPAAGNEHDEFPDVTDWDFDKVTQAYMRKLGHNPDKLREKIKTGIGDEKKNAAIDAASWTDVANNNNAATNWLRGQQVLTAKDVSKPQSVGAFQAITGSIANGFVDIVSAVPKLTLAQFELQKGLANKAISAVTGQQRSAGAFDIAEWTDYDKSINNFFSPYKTFISDNYKEPLFTYNEKDGVGWNINADSLVGLVSNGAEFMVPGLLTAGVGTVASLGTRAAVAGATNALALTQGAAKLASIGSKVKYITGVSTFLQTFPSYQKEAQDAGLDIMDSALIALPLAGIGAVIETASVGNLTKALGLTDGVAKQVIREVSGKQVVRGLKELAENPLWSGMMVETATKEARNQLKAQLLTEAGQTIAKRTLIDLSNHEEMGILARLLTGTAKRVGRGMVEQGIPEAGEEFVQSLIENSSKQIYNNFFAREGATEQDGRFKDPKFSDYVYQSIYGSLNGFLLGSTIGTLAQSRQMDPTLFGYVAAGTRTALHDGATFEQIIGDAQNPGIHPIFETLEEQRRNGTFTDQQAAELRGKVRLMATTARDYDKIAHLTDGDRFVLYDLAQNRQQIETQAAQIADVRAQLNQIDTALADGTLSPADKLQATIQRNELLQTVGGDIDQAETGLQQKQLAFQSLDAATTDSYSRREIDNTDLQGFYQNNLSAYRQQVGVATDEDQFVPFRKVSDPSTGTTIAFDASQKVFRLVERAGGEIVSPASLDADGRYVRAQRTPTANVMTKSVSNLPDYLTMVKSLANPASEINQSVQPYTEPDNSPESGWLTDGQNLLETLTQVQTQPKKKKPVAAAQQLATAYLRDSQFLADDAGYAQAYAPIQSGLQTLLGIQPEIATQSEPNQATQSASTNPNDIPDAADIENRLQTAAQNTAPPASGPVANSQSQPTTYEPPTVSPVATIAPATPAVEPEYPAELERKASIDAARAAQQKLDEALRNSEEIADFAESDLATLSGLIETAERADHAIAAVVGPIPAESGQQPVNPVDAPSGRNTPTPTLRESWPNLTPDVQIEATGLAQSYLNGYDGGNLSSVERRIYETLGKIRDLKEGWTRWADPNSFTQSIARAYAAKVSQPSAPRLDQYVAVQQEEMPSLTEQDIIDFMTKFPSGVDKAKTYGLEPLNQRFIELTGKKLDFSSAKNVVSFRVDAPASPVEIDDLTPDDVNFAEQLLAEFTPEGIEALNDWISTYKAEYGEEWLIQLDKQKSELQPPFPQTLERLLEQAVDQYIFNNNQDLYNDTADAILALSGRSETRPGDGARGLVEESTSTVDRSGSQSAETGEPIIATLKDQTTALERQVSDSTEAGSLDELEQSASERIALAESEISTEVSSNPTLSQLIAPLDEAIAAATGHSAAGLQQMKLDIAEQLVRAEQPSAFPQVWKSAETAARTWSESKAIENRLAAQIDAVANNPAGLDAEVDQYRKRAQNAVLAGQSVRAQEWQQVPDELYHEVNSLFDQLNIPKTGIPWSDFSNLLSVLPGEVGAYASSGQGINPAGILNAPDFWPFWNRTVLPIIQGRLGNEQSAELKESALNQKRRSEKAFEDYFTQVDAIGQANLLTLGNQDLLTELERAGLPVPESIRIRATRYSQQSKANGLPTPSNLESDRPRTAAADPVGANDFQLSGRTEPGPVAGAGGSGPGEGRLSQQSDSGVSARSAAAAGEPVDSELPIGASARGLTDDASGRADDPGSAAVDAARIQHAKPGSGEGIGDLTGKGGRFADLVRQTRQALTQLDARVADRTNIDQMLPVLLDNQRENVQKAEQRLLVDNQKGILFTDGTGTGKTLSGLGIIARFQKLLGTDDILIVVPSDKKAKDWIEEGRFVGMEITQLEGIKNAGRGLSVTTYANFGQNEAILHRNWRLVVYDESQNLNSNADGKSTLAQNRHRDLTNPALDAYYKARDEFKEQYRQADQLDSFDQPGEVRQQGRTLRKAIDEKRKARTRELIDATKVVFLSATPFAYHKNLAYADGFLFKAYQDLDADLKPVASGSGAYNSGDAFDKLLMGAFGYTMRYNKLTRPEAGVDIGLLEREFVENLKKTGAVSSTRLNIPQDYSRQFVVLSDQGDVIGRTIDEGFRIMNEDERFRDLAEAVRKNFNYLRRAQLLENLKAKLAISRIQQHLEMGRKVVVFHSYNKSEITHPFQFDYLLESATGDDLATKRSAISQAKVFSREFPQFARLDLTGLANPIDALTVPFGNQVAVFNGNKTPKERSAAVRAFNDDTSPVKVIVVNLAAGEAGLNLHDTTGKFQRVEMQIGLPVRPTSAIQAEGRIYRQGQKSDAVFEYLITGTSFEQMTFGTNISSRASTAENMGIGSGARDLESAFRDGYADATADAPSLRQGQGGKQTDNVESTVTPFDKAITYYYKRQKKNQKTKSFEGTDYFGTPEPLGYKMAEWAQIQRGTDVAEPSAGHGAIARFVPAGVNLTTIEPSSVLRAELAVAVGGSIISGRFEDHHAVNKYDTILMNPPFGTAGKTAFDHVRKAFNHLKDQGRLIALVPVGQFDDRFTKWLGEISPRTGKPSVEVEPVHVAARILLPSSTFERAGTNVNTQILIIDKEYTAALREKMPMTRTVDLRGQAATSEELFDLIRELDMPARIAVPEDTTGVSSVADRSLVSMPVAQAESTAIDQSAAPTASTSLPSTGRTALVLAPVKNRHAKKGTDIFVVQMAARLSDEQYQRIKTISGRYSGYYSSFRGNGAIPGFIFNTEQQAQAFNAEVNGVPSAVQPVEQAGPQFQLPDDFGNKVVAIIPVTQGFANIRQAKDFAQANLIGKTFHNKDTGEDILVSRNAIDKTFSQSALEKSTRNQAHIDALFALPQLLEESILGEQYPDRADNFHVQQIQRFYGAVRQMGETYRVKTTVKRIRQEGNKFYTYEIQEMELLPARPNQIGKGVSDEGINPTTDSNSITVANLLDGAVKNNGEPFFDLPTSFIDRQVATDANPELTAFVETLKVFDPAIPVVADLAGYERALSDSGSLQKTGGRRPKGFEWQGRVYLDPTQATAKTALHEFGHVWVNISQKSYPDLFSQGDALVRDSVYFKQLRFDPFYNSLPQSQQVKEAMARAIEDKGARFVTEGRRLSFLNWLQELGRKIGEWVGFITPKDPLDMTLEEWVEQVIQKTRGQNLGDAATVQMNAQTAQQPQFQLAGDTSSITDRRLNAQTRFSSPPTGVTLDLLTTPAVLWTSADRAFVQQIATETGWKLTGPEQFEWQDPKNLYFLSGGRSATFDNYQLGQVVNQGFGEAYHAAEKGLFNKERLFRSMTKLMRNWTNLETFIGWLDDRSGTLKELIQGVKTESMRRAAYASITLQPLRTQSEKLLANFSDELAGQGLARTLTARTWTYDPAGNIIESEVNLPISVAMGAVLSADTLSASKEGAAHVTSGQPTPDQLYTRNPDGSLTPKTDGSYYEDAEGNRQYLLFDQSQIDQLRNRFESGFGGYAGEPAAYQAIKDFFNNREINRMLEAENGELPPNRSFDANPFFYPVSSSQVGQSGQSGTRTLANSRVLVDRQALDERQQQELRTGIVLKDPVRVMGQYASAVDDVLQYGRLVQNMERLSSAIDSTYNGPEKKQILRYLRRRIDDYQNHKQKRAEAYEENSFLRSVENWSRRYIQSVFSVNLKLPLLQSGTYLSAYGVGAIKSEFLNKAAGVALKLARGAYSDITAKSILNTGEDDYRTKLMGVETNEAEYVRWIQGEHIQDPTLRERHRQKFATIIHRISGGQELHAGSVEFRDLGLNNKTLTKAQQLLKSADGWADQWGTGMMKRSDRGVILAFVEAAKYQAEAEGLDPNSEAYVERVSDLAERTVFATNQMSQLTEMTGMQLSNDFFSKIVGLFSGQSQKLLNTVMQAMTTYVKAPAGTPEASEALKRLAFAFGNGVLFNALYVSALGALGQMVMRFLSGDDQKESEEIVKQIGIDFARNVVGMAPGLGEMAVSYWLNNHDTIHGNESMIDVLGLETITEGVDAADAIGSIFTAEDEEKREKAIDSALYNITNFAAHATGTPSSIWRLGREHFEHIVLEDEEDEE